MNNDKQAGFEAWLSTHCDYDDLNKSEIELANEAWQAALASTEVQALREALRGMLHLDEENHQRYAGDDDVCKEVRDARAALAAMEKQK